MKSSGSFLDVGPVPLQPSDAFLRRRHAIDTGIRLVLFVAAALSVLVTFGILYVLLSESLKFFTQVSIVDFLTDTQWTPVFEEKHFGIMTLLSGTLMTTAIALVVAVPAGTILALYLSEFAKPRLREAVKPFLELIAGVPTVAFGYFALLFLTPIFQSFIPGLARFNLLVSGVVIGIMILPYIVSMSEDAMRAVPDSLREGAYALGFTRLQTGLKVVTPAALSGVTAAYLLGMSRAVGETMVVAIAAGQQARIATNPLEGAATITSYIVQLSMGDLPHESIAYQTIFAAGLTLFALTFSFNLFAFWLRKRYREAY
ncbi:MULTISPECIES: phosphate ABC transporter permease subunit PstC [Stenotrophomonas]|jgi:phosphate transport system permease protein|uniref:Phosphate transport system permease protein n=1 Tax=Stenotrophomonas maltophilia TaxID=40324 RepID=A0AAI9FWV7_STEMA|nr:MULTISPECIES: phosphate ABC transporter permease subunit PstC [Stenotrophomonas]EKT4441689.1 phosphate ABC transporter permease subunit PstC [Stenotrophomonas maltophilia]MBN5011911.1 phosphate ABC transporter permease subunit PstC [Stenotrophomonas maltophilia]MDH0276679.1 phosphate ABC transporter permease subunit PstC [Stenotrophomonas sp. GD04089]MDH1913281.1 phosphate ABC transporter permease subunit PstC [Stenotrophomonas sp. GD03794]HDS1305425.1 phosphate ABC transporter permease sub